MKRALAVTAAMALAVKAFCGFLTVSVVGGVTTTLSPNPPQGTYIYTFLTGPTASVGVCSTLDQFTASSPTSKASHVGGSQTVNFTLYWTGFSASDLPPSTVYLHMTCFDYASYFSSLTLLVGTGGHIYQGGIESTVSGMPSPAPNVSAAVTLTSTGLGTHSGAAVGFGKAENTYASLSWTKVANYGLNGSIYKCTTPVQLTTPTASAQDGLLVMPNAGSTLSALAHSNADYSVGYYFSLTP